MGCACSKSDAKNNVEAADTFDDLLLSHVMRKGEYDVVVAHPPRPSTAPASPVKRRRSKRLSQEFDQRHAALFSRDANRLGKSTTSTGRDAYTTIVVQPKD